jgi:hypothetical protein
MKVCYENSSGEKKNDWKICTLFVKSVEETEGESTRQLAAPRKRATEESDLLEAPSISRLDETLSQQMPIRALIDERVLARVLVLSGDQGILCYIEKWGDQKRSFWISQGRPGGASENEFTSIHQ